MTDERGEFTNALKEALAARREWLETGELPRLRDDIRVFHTAFSSISAMCVKKGSLYADPYKQAVEAAGLALPEEGEFAGSDWAAKFSLRLSNYDNQLTFLDSACRFDVDYLNMERTLLVLSLFRWIDWTRLSTEAARPNTRAMAEIVSQTKTGLDSMAARILNESLSQAAKSAGLVTNRLQALLHYHQEAWKLRLRETVLSAMPPQEAAKPARVKARFEEARPGTPFYGELAEEVIKEDHSPEGPSLREKVLAALYVADAPRKAPPAPAFREALLDGIGGLASAGGVLMETREKTEANRLLLEQSQKRCLFERLRRFLARLLGRACGETVYEVERRDGEGEGAGAGAGGRGAGAGGPKTKERVNITRFTGELEMKALSLSSISGLSPASPSAAQTRLEGMDDGQLLQFLERSIRELQSYHRTLSALDDYFKTKIGEGKRDRVKGIRPELAALQNAIVRAVQKRDEYTALKEGVL